MRKREPITPITKTVAHTHIVSFSTCSLKRISVHNNRLYRYKHLRRHQFTHNSSHTPTHLTYQIFCRSSWKCGWLAGWLVGGPDPGLLFALWIACQCSSTTNHSILCWIGFCFNIVVISAITCRPANNIYTKNNNSNINDILVQLFWNKSARLNRNGVRLISNWDYALWI